MAEFLVEKKPTEPATYQVHNIHCSAVSDADAQRYLGSYANAEAAFNKAIGLYSGVDCCTSCINH